MAPVRFTCVQVMKIGPDEVRAGILDVEQWTDFRGYGPLPGIRRATFVERTPEVVGSRIAVENEDGSTHVEQIVAWGDEIAMRMSSFSPPLSRLATHFDESWRFETIADGTRVERTFVLHAKSAWTRPLLSLIALPLRRAVARHLASMAG
ncbi:MAG: SRPBCC family protein [Deltaproteobacteria bacterium]